MRPDHLFQVFKLDRRCLVEFGKLFQPIKLFALVVGCSHRTVSDALQAIASRKTVRLAAPPHLFVHRQARVRDHQQCVFLTAIHGHLIRAAHAVVHEFNNYFFPDSINVPVTPILKGIGGRLSTTFFHGSFIAAT